MFTQLTVLNGNEVAQSVASSDEYEEATGQGVPTAMRASVETVKVDFPFNWYDTVIRHAWKFVANATCAQLDTQHTEAIDSRGQLSIRQAVEAGQVQLDELADRLGPHAHRYGVHPADGQAFLDYLLEHIGLAVSALSTRRSPITWAALHDGDLPREDLAGKAVTWGDLARLSEPALRRLLPQDTR